MKCLFYLGFISLFLFSSRKLVKAEDEAPQVFFLMMAYEGINNIQCWNLFFNHTNPSHYKFFLHVSEDPAPESQETSFDVLRIPTVKSEYMKVQLPMIALTDAALSVSKHEHDMFVFLSADSLPVKPFHAIREILCLSLPTVSSLCITPTAQWCKSDQDLDIVKSHQWIILNKRDASQAVTIGETKPAFKQIVPKSDCGKNGMEVAEEEIWFTSAINGLYNRSSTYNSLNYPSSVEQGICRTYVYWDDYPQNSQFEIGNRFGIKTHGLKDTPLAFFLALKASDNFLFARKVPGYGDYEVTVVDRNGNQVKIHDAFKTVAFYHKMQYLHVENQ